MIKKLAGALLLLIVVSCSGQNCPRSKYRKLMKIYPEESSLNNMKSLQNSGTFNDVDFTDDELKEFYHIVLDSACHYYSEKEIDAILDCKKKGVVCNDTLLDKLIGFISMARETGRKWACTKALEKFGYSYNEGIDAYYKLNFQAAWKYFDKKINVDHDTTYENYLFLGKSLGALDRDSESVAAFKCAIKINASEPEAFYSLAYAYLYHLDEPDSAYNSIQNALKLKPSENDYKILLGDIFCSKSDFDRGINEFSSILADDPDNISALNSRALAYAFHGDTKEAYNDYKNALKIDDQDKEALRGLWLFFTKQHINDSAFGYAQKLVLYHPDDPDGYSFLGGFYVQREKYDTAISYLSKAIDQGGGANELNSRGYAYLESGEYEKARMDLKRVIDSTEKNFTNKYAIAMAYNNLGYVEYKLGNNKAAMENIGQSIDLFPENSYAYRNKALVFISLHRTDDACQALQKAKALNFAEYYGDEVDKLILENCR